VAAEQASAGRMFFLEKKNQKTFDFYRVIPMELATA
jgi:hypothetical protein